MKPEELRIALFSGNYNYVRDGANQSLNRLVGFLLRQGAHVRVYSPTVERPAFPPTGDLVSVPSVAIPGRSEYRLAYRLPGDVRSDIAAFRPNIFHVAAPDIVAHRAVTLARRSGTPVISSVHTRFDTYLQYYNLKWLEPVARAIMRRYYRRCDAIVVPSESMAAIMRAQRMNRDISIWARGVDRSQFNPQRRSVEWRRARGIGRFTQRVNPSIGTRSRMPSIRTSTPCCTADAISRAPNRVYVTAWDQEPMATPASHLMHGVSTGT